MKIQGIYQIRNATNGKVYIGSSIDIRRRWRSHRSELNNGRHSNTYLQNSWNKFGERNFVFEILENVNREKDLLVREQWYLDNNVRWRYDYNISKRAGKPRGMVGKKNHMWGRRGKDSPNWGRKHTPEELKRMSEANIGKTHSPEALKKMSGENHPASILTEENVLRIRELWRVRAFTQRYISRLFNVSPATISDIVLRKTWRHI